MVESLSCDEMKRLLSKGKKPIDVSILKWSRGIKNKDWASLGNAGNCALCHVHTDIFGGNHMCDGCPLRRYYMKCVTHYGSGEDSLFTKMGRAYDYSKKEKYAKLMLAKMREVRKIMKKNGEY